MKKTPITNFVNEEDLTIDNIIGYQLATKVKHNIKPKMDNTFALYSLSQVMEMLVNIPKSKRDNYEIIRMYDDNKVMNLLTYQKFKGCPFNSK